MNDPVDEVFGGGGGEEPPALVSPVPRLRWMLAAAFFLIVVGPACFTGVPGGGLAIWAWIRADETLILVENGVLPAHEGRPARRVRNLAFAAMGSACVLTIVQLFLFGMGFYDALAAFVVGGIEMLLLRFG